MTVGNRTGEIDDELYLATCRYGTAETSNTSDEQPENQLNFDFVQGDATETVTQ